MDRARNIALVSLLFTAIFFLEYTSALDKVHIPYDLNSYHYPLADYAFQAIRGGRLPQWDPTIYCGMSFVANVQAALFYPPQWIMIAGSLGTAKLSYQSLEYLAFAHVWLAFLLCFFWLHDQKRLHWLASTLGAGGFAFSGFMLLQLQHFGLIGAYAWMPLGFWAIDESAATGRRRPLWKLALAFAMCILAGYPSMWVVFAVSMAAYAAARAHPLRLIAAVGLAMMVSLLLAAAQLLPAFEAVQGKTPDAKYGWTSGFKDPAFFISYIAPNYYDFGLNVDVQKNHGKEYLYLGSSVLAGLALLVYRRRFQGAAPLLAVLAASVFFLTNPFGLAGRAMHETLLADVFSDWYFLAGVTAALAPLAALGLDAGLRHSGKTWPPWLAAIVIALTALWSIRLGILWIKQSLPALWLSGVDALIATLLCSALIAIFAGSRGRMAMASAATLLILAAVEYKAFGTSKRFNAAPGPFDADYSLPAFQGMNEQTYKVLRAHPEYRMASDDYGPDPVNLRHAGLTTPQGFDPFLTTAYRNLIASLGHFSSNRRFELFPENEAALHLLGVRYFGTAEGGAMYSRLKANPRYRLMLPDDSYYKIFELADSQPAFAWEAPDPQTAAQATAWEPESRVLKVRSISGGVFRLSEQYFPGWHATVDGFETPIDRCHEAFQCIAISPGDHSVEFSFHSRWLRTGAMISLFTLSLGIALLNVKRLRTY
jgi:hypothetical protein